MTTHVYLTPSEAATILKISADTIRGYAKRGILPARKFGKHWRFIEAELLEAGKNGYYQSPTPRALRFQKPISSGRIDEIVRRARAKYSTPDWPALPKVRPRSSPKRSPK